MKPITEYLGQMLLERSARGLAKYGTTIDRDDLRRSEWLQHLVEELLDAAQYVEAERRQAEVQEAEIARLNAIINAPQSDDFLRAVSTEAEHQRQRWPDDHDAGKTPADWFWLLGHLAGKAVHAQAAGDITKAEHHVITTAAACANWHRSIQAEKDKVRSG